LLLDRSDKETQHFKLMTDDEPRRSGERPCNSKPLTKPLIRLIAHLSHQPQIAGAG
jgi:hypothetical protein